MINSWSLLYDELYGDDEMSENKNDWGGEDKIENSISSCDDSINFKWKYNFIPNKCTKCN